MRALQLINGKVVDAPIAVGGAGGGALPVEIEAGESFTIAANTQVAQVEEIQLDGDLTLDGVLYCGVPLGLRTFAPTAPVAEGLQIWLDPSDPTTLTLDMAGQITAVANKGLLGGTYTRSPSNASLTLDSTTFAAGSFKFSGGELSTAVSQTTQNFEAFALVKPDVAGGPVPANTRDNLMWGSSTNETVGRFIEANGQVFEWVRVAGQIADRASTISADYFDAQIQNFSLRSSGSPNARAFINGIEVSLAPGVTPGAVSGSVFQNISGFGGGNNYRMFASVGPILYYNRTLTTEERAAVFAYIQNVWGVS